MRQHRPACPVAVEQPTKGRKTDIRRASPLPRHSARPAARPEVYTRPQSSLRRAPQALPIKSEIDITRCQANHPRHPSDRARRHHRYGFAPRRRRVCITRSCSITSNPISLQILRTSYRPLDCCVGSRSTPRSHFSMILLHQVTSVFTLSVVSFSRVTVATLPKNASSGSITPPNKSIVVMFCLPPVAPRRSLPISVKVPIGVTSPAIEPVTLLVVMHDPWRLVKTVPDAGNRYRPTSDVKSPTVAKINPSNPFSVSVSISPVPPLLLLTTHVALLTFSALQPVNLTSTLPTDIAPVISPEPVM
jgi:hypothetical protein